MLTPIQMRIHAAGGGELGVLKFSTNGQSENYSPSAGGDFTPGADGTLNVMGIYENIPQEGQATIVQAKFMFACSAEIPRLQSDDAKILIRDTTFSIKQARRRVYRGVIDGYSLELVK